MIIIMKPLTRFISCIIIKTSPLRSLSWYLRYNVGTWLINVIIDVIDCLLCNAGCCNMKHVTLLKIIF